MFTKEDMKLMVIFSDDNIKDAAIEIIQETATVLIEPIMCPGHILTQEIKEQIIHHCFNRGPAGLYYKIKESTKY